MLRVVRCILHRHCPHCHCHYQKYRCRIHLIRCLRINHHAILFHLATCFFQQELKIVAGAMLVVVVVMLVVFLRYIPDSASLVPFILQVSLAHLETVVHSTTKAQVHRPYLWSTLRYRGQFA